MNFKMLLVAAVTCGTIGCGGHPSPVMTPQLGEYEGVGLEPAPLYLIQAGDLLSLTFARAADISGEYRVRPDGRITLPFVGDEIVEGLSPGVLQHHLEELYAATLKDPRVSVGVAEFRQPKIFIGGQVERPGVYDFARGLTAFRATLAAGGFTDQAARSRALLIRNTGDRTPESFEVDLERVFESGKGASDPYLQPQDILIIPRSNVGTIDLFVDQYIDSILPDLVERGFSYAIGVLAADEARKWRDDNIN
jgi:polysaccharide export outer membrane protein